MRAWIVLLALLGIPATSTAQTLLDAPLKTVVPIRTLDGNTEDFSNIDTWWLTVSPAGNPVVLDGAVNQLRFYHAAGQAPSLFGRRGQGPSEFRVNMLTIGWIADTLWVFDPGNLRLTFLSSAGKSLREIPSPKIVAPSDGPAKGVRLTRPRAILPDHSYIYSGISGVSASARNVLVHVTADEHPDRVIATYAMQHATASVPVKMPTGETGTRSFMGRTLDPAGSEDAVAPAGDWVVTKHTDLGPGNEAQVHLMAIRSTGVAIFDRVYSLRGEVVPDSLQKVPAGFSTDPVVLKQIVAAMPRVWAPVEFLVAGRDSVTWLQLRANASGTPLVMLDRRGNPTAKVVVPGKKVKLVQATSTSIWVISLNEDDIPSVIGYRIQR